MKLLVAALSLGIAFAGTADAQVRVRPHFRADGTFVPGHVRTAPNSSRSDNWSTSPNYNPYTGRIGTENPYPTFNTPRPAPLYPQPKRRSYGSSYDDQPECTSPYGC